LLKEHQQRVEGENSMTKALRTFILAVGLIVISGGVLMAIWMMWLPSPELDLSAPKASFNGIFHPAVKAVGAATGSGEPTFNLVQ